MALQRNNFIIICVILSRRVFLSCANDYTKIFSINYLIYRNAIVFKFTALWFISVQFSSDQFAFNEVYATTHSKKKNIRILAPRVISMEFQSIFSFNEKFRTIAMRFQLVRCWYYFWFRQKTQNLVFVLLLLLLPRAFFIFRCVCFVSRNLFA